MIRMIRMKQKLFTHHLHRHLRNTTSLSSSSSDGGSGSGDENLYIRVSNWCLKKSLCLNNYQLFEVYSKDSEWMRRYQERRRIDNSPAVNGYLELSNIAHLEPPGDRKPRSEVLARHLFSLYLAYVLVKFLMISTLHYFLHFSRRPMCSYWPSCEQDLWRLLRLLGDPMEHFLGDSIFFSAALVIPTFCFLVVMPWKLKGKTLDLAPVRLIFDPDRELDRIDFTIQLKIDKFIESLQAYKMFQAKGTDLFNLDQKGSLISLHQIHKNNQHQQEQLQHEQQQQQQEVARCILNRLVEQNQIQLSSYRLNGFKTLRPDYCRPAQRARAKAEAAQIVWSVGIFWLVWMMFLGISLYLLGYRLRCDHLKSVSLGEKCNWQAGTDLSEKIVVVELFITSGLFIIAMGLHLGLVSILIRSHLRLVSGMRNDLLKCMEVLTRSNYLNRSQSSSLVDEDEIDQSSLSDRLWREREVDQVLIESLIKIEVAAEEFRGGAKSVSQIFTPLIFSSFVIFTSSLITRNWGTPHLATHRRTIIFINWCATNIVALLCANNLSQFIQLERLFWSVKAELLVRRRNRISRISMDFMSISWHKMADYLKSTSHLYTSHAIVLSATYRTVIEFNFSMISVLSLLVLTRL